MRHRWRASVALVLAVGMGAAAAAARSESGHAGTAPRLSEAAVLDLDLEFYRRRVQRDSLSARDEGELARLYLQRGRMNASEPDLRAAETHARRSLRLRSGHNS